MSDVIIDGLLKKVVSLAAEEIILAWGFKSELKTLSERLETTQALLRDAQSRPVSLEVVQLWLKNLGTVACDADDVLDKYAYKVLRGKLQIENQLRSKVRNFFSLSNPMIFHLNMAHKVKNINTKLDNIYKKANEIGLEPVALINAVVEHREPRETPPYVDDSKVVGRDGDVSIVLDMLRGSNDDDDLPVIAIVGMPGVGKTTLAQLVYNDEEVVSNFGERMWVCVSTDFNVTKVLNKMLEYVTGTKDAMSNTGAMIKKLRDNFNGKKYLLVLDDAWNDDDPESWDNMRHSLLGIGGAKGSKIVVTTRSRLVASTMQISPSHTHLLDPLSENDSWTIFEKRAFADGGPTQTSSLLDVGKRLIGRCGGLPLAIKALGALMYSKKNENEWISIERSETWSNTDVLPTLKLSFDHLQSPSLKQCFAYCSLYPKDCVYEKNYLIELWMAQGYLEPPEENSLEILEDRGNNYFDSLLWNSLLEVVEKDEYDNVISCKMHDLVHDLALNIAKGSCLTMETGKVCDISKVQHLSLDFETSKVPELSKGSCHKLRTLVWVGDFLGDLLREFTCLHVLYLAGCKIKELPKSIGKLIHLRHLDISRNPIERLPNSICELYHLQTFGISDCLFLEALPKEFKNLVSLRHFYMDDDDEHRKLMPMGMGQLTCLRTLPFFVVGQDKGRGIEELGRLLNLRGVLKIYNLEHVRSKVEAEKANLSTNSNIHELKLHWCGEREADSNRDEDVLEGLKPHRNLKGLTIENFYGGKLASWMFTISDTSVLYGLVKLILKNCKTLEYIPTLGHLPWLKILSIEGIHNVKHIRSEFYELDDEIREMTTGAATTTIFPALRELSLVDMPNLLEWSEADCLRSGVRVVFPCLEKLRISGCSNLIRAPADFPFIKELVIEEVNSVALEKMSNSLTSLTSLSLSKSSGHEIDFVLNNLLKTNRSIKKLVIEECEELSHLPKELWALASLEEFEIKDCPNLMSVPDIIIEEETGGGGSIIYRLRELRIADCNKLSCLPNGLRNLTSLERLHILGCDNLTGINPSDMRCLKSLRLLGIPYSGLLGNSSCWPEWLFSLTSLLALGIGGFSEELDYFPWPSSSSSSTTTPVSPDHLLLSLKVLGLFGWPNLKSLPDQLPQLTSLVDLTIVYFVGLEALPDWLGNLSSLKSLCLWSCENLKHLPSVESMRRLTNLEIRNSPLLAERCKRGSGPEWNKIAHIPSIKINDKYIQNKY